MNLVCSLRSLSSMIVALVALCVLLTAGTTLAQDVPHAYKGLVPGQATREDVDRVLGAPPAQSGRDYHYPVEGHPALSDRLFFSSDELEGVSAASADPRYPSRDKITALFGQPEVEIRFQTQEFLEYSERGLRFICNADGKTIGTIYFVPTKRRVPASYPHQFDLRRDETSNQPAEPPAGFQVGAAQASIAPQRYDNLTADAGDKPFHLEEDVFARVAIFQQGEKRLVFVGLDAFIFGPWDSTPLRESLARKGFQHVFIALSHTHANVDLMGFYGYYPREYAEHVARQTEAAVLEAARNMTPIRSLRRGTTEMSLAGGRVVDLILNWRDPGLLDPTVSLIQAIGQDGRPILNLIHLTCHPEVIRLEEKRGISPDFVGALCTEVTRQLGGQTVFLNGALGGMVSPEVESRDYETAVAMGKNLARYVVDAAENARPMCSYDLWTHRRPVEIPVTSEGLVRFLKNTPKPFDFRDDRAQTEMNVVWVGDVQFITVPGELLPQLGIEMMSHMKGALRMVMGLTNDEFGYIIPSFDFHAGRYEEKTGPSPEAGEIVRRVGIELAPMRPQP